MKKLDDPVLRVRVESFLVWLVVTVMFGSLGLLLASLFCE